MSLFILENVERPGRDGNTSSELGSSNEFTPNSNMSHAPAMNTSSTTSIVSDTGVINSILNSMQTMQQTMLGLQQTVIRLASDRPTTERSLETLRIRFKQRPKLGLLIGPRCHPI